MCRPWAGAESSVPHTLHGHYDDVAGGAARLHLPSLTSTHSFYCCVMCINNCIHSGEISKLLCCEQTLGILPGEVVKLKTG